MNLLYSLSHVERCINAKWSAIGKMETLCMASGFIMMDQFLKESFKILNHRFVPDQIQKL